MPKAIHGRLTSESFHAPTKIAIHACMSGSVPGWPGFASVRSAGSPRASHSPPGTKGVTAPTSNHARALVAQCAQGS